ncbi:hypothetical protein PMKS-002581 [Pichia membranifaciens]|uniref:Uncharacterized protein n=1 Tax=Pichia membranifaciens TaxID=4926 RepID=A0A1Q2YHZ1_9ASCO|nr:hypothetical protein PMKS-002581 [Pichia membranifaciens]
MVPGDEIHIISESVSRLNTANEDDDDLASAVTISPPTADDTPDTATRGKDVPSKVKIVGRRSPKRKSERSGVWCVVQSKGDWVNGINGMLGFNLGFKSSKSDK